jgi:hypothetical protein
MNQRKWRKKISVISGHLRTSAGSPFGSSAALIAYSLNLYELIDRQLTKEEVRQQQQQRDYLFGLQSPIL